MTGQDLIDYIQANGYQDLELVFAFSLDEEKQCVIGDAIGRSLSGEIWLTPIEEDERM